MNTMSAPESSTPTSPVWLLDVDGPLNGSRCGWGSAPSRATAYSQGRAYTMRWSAPAMDIIRALHVSRALEVRWATTWAPDADQLERLMGLPPLVRSLTVEDVATIPKSMAAKQAAALAVVEVERRPLVWTDDEAIPDDSEFHARLRSAGQPLLLLAPHSSRGLREEHLDAVTAFTHRCAELTTS